MRHVLALSALLSLVLTLALVGLAGEAEGSSHSSFRLLADNPQVVRPGGAVDVRSECVINGDASFEAAGPVTLREPARPPGNSDTFHAPGTYVLQFTCGANTETLTVLYHDARPPAISLNGPAQDFHPAGSPYPDGAACADRIDDVVDFDTEGRVDGSVPGWYDLSYTCTDRSGNPATASREVYVYGAEGPVTVEILGRDPYGVPAGGDYRPPVPGARCAPNPAVFADGRTPGFAARAEAGAAPDVSGLEPFSITGHEYRCTVGGFTASASRTIVVGDDSPPVISYDGPVAINHTESDDITVPGITCTDRPEAVDAGQVVTEHGRTKTSLVAAVHCEDSAGNRSEEVRVLVRLVDVTPPVMRLTGDEFLADTVAIPPALELCEDPWGGPVGHYLSRNGSFWDPTRRSDDFLPPGATLVDVVCIDGSGNSARDTVTYHVDTGRMPVIMHGANITHPHGEPLPDPGATCTDASGRDLPVRVKGRIDLGRLGMQHLVFECGDAHHNNATSRWGVDVVDTKPPEVVLYGPENYSHFERLPFPEPGFTCVDDADPDPVRTTRRLESTLPPGGYLASAEGDMVVIKYTCTDASGNAASKHRTIYILRDVYPSLAINGSVRLVHQEGTPYDDPGATCSDAAGNRLPVTTGRTPDGMTEGEYGVTYTCSLGSGPSTRTIMQTRTVIVEDNEPPVMEILGTGCGEGPGCVAFDQFDRQFYTVLHHEQGEEYWESRANPGARCVDAVDGPVPMGPKIRVNVDVPGVYVNRYSCADLSGNVAHGERRVIVSDTAPPVLDVGDPDVVLVERGTEYVDAPPTCTDSVDGGLRVLSSGAADRISGVGQYPFEYICADGAGNHDTADRSVFVYDARGPAVVLYGAREVTVEQHGAYVEEEAYCQTYNRPRQPLAHVLYPLPGTDVPGTFSVTYACVDWLGNLGFGERQVVITDRTKPVIMINGSSEFRVGVGSTYADPGAVCIDMHEGDISHRLVLGGEMMDTSAPGPRTVTFDCDDSSGNNADTVVREVEVVDGLRVVVHGEPLVDREGGLPTGTCLGAGEPRTIAGDVDPPFDPERAFTFEDRGAPHASNFTCTDGKTYLATNSTAFTHVNAYPVISIPGFESDHLGETTASQLRNLRVAGEAYADDAAMCYHYTYGEAGPSDRQFNVTSPITPGTEPGIYHATYTCGATDSAGGELFDVKVRRVSVVARLVPEIKAADAKHPLGREFVDTAVCRGLFNNTIPHELAVSGPSGPVDPIGPSTPDGIYDALYTCTQDYLGAEFEAAPASAKIEVVSPGRGSDPEIAGGDVIHFRQGTEPPAHGLTCADGPVDLTGTISPDVVVDENTPNGNVTVTYTCTDARESKTDTHEITYIVDGTPPVISPATGTVTLELGDAFRPEGPTCADPYPRAAIGQIDTAGIPGVEAALLSRAESSPQITYDCEDAVGNSAAQSVRTFRILDTTPPAAPSVSMPTVDVPEDAALDLGDVTCAQDRGTPVVLRNTTTLDGAPYVGPINTSEPGTYRITYTCHDANQAGDPASQTISIRDTTAPVLDGNAPSPAYVMSGPDYTSYAGYTLTCTDGGQPANDRISFEPPLASLAERPAAMPHEVEIYCPDAFRNTINNKTAEIVVDDTDPVPPEPPNRDIERDAVFEHGQTCTQDTGSPVDQEPELEIRNTDGDEVQLVDTSSVTTYTIKYTCHDAAGNSLQGAAQTIMIVDTTAPALTGNAPSPAYVMSGSDYVNLDAYTLTCTDDGQPANDRI
ncbi:MAG: DUF5011 domain-containing protein, partial [Nitrosopumilus sp.]|nr:DUF5011 domain-containing protein [Nitrosopumilus sp.]